LSNGATDFCCAIDCQGYILTTNKVYEIKSAKQREFTFLNIEIITTAIESLSNTGFGSEQACQDFYAAISNEYQNSKLSPCYSLDDIGSVAKRKPDFVILADKHILIRAKDAIWLSEYFEDAGIEFTGSGKNALAYDVDKVSAKKKIFSSGIMTADFFTALPGEYHSKQMLPIPFPLFLKPIQSANSNGIDIDSIVYDFDHFRKKVGSLYETYQSPILAESYLCGREFTVAILETGTTLNAFALEITAPRENGVRILSRKVKYDNTETLSTVTDTTLLAEIIQLAKNSFRVLGARDFGRIDIKMDHLNNCHFVEVNLTPGVQKEISYFPKALEMNSRLTYDKMAVLMVQGAHIRVKQNMLSEQ